MPPEDTDDLVMLAEELLQDLDHPDLAEFDVAREHWGRGRPPGRLAAIEEDVD